MTILNALSSCMTSHLTSRPYSNFLQSLFSCILYCHIIFNWGPSEMTVFPPRASISCPNTLILSVTNIHMPSVPFKSSLSSSKYLLSCCYLPDIILSVRNIMKKTLNPNLWGLHARRFRRRRLHFNPLKSTSLLLK